MLSKYLRKPLLDLGHFRDCERSLPAQQLHDPGDEPIEVLLAGVLNQGQVRPSYNSFALDAPGDELGHISVHLSKFIVE